MGEHEDDVAGSLIDALADEGRHVDDGGFTLDAATALAKLREHQLRDPHEYLLLLVEAAWIGSRSGGISIECRATTTAVFRGPTLEPAALRELFASVFGKTRDLDGEALRRARVLQLLALAANSARALGPELITIEARDERGQSWRLRVSSDGELSLEPGEAPEPGRIRPPKIRFCLHGRGSGRNRARAERDLVLDRCGQLGWLEGVSKFWVEVDDVRVVRSPARAFVCEAPVRLGDRQIGVAGHLPHASVGRVWLVNRGVGVEIPDTYAPAGFLAVVEGDLPMDVSRKQIVEGPELAAIREAIHDARRSLPVNDHATKAIEDPKKSSHSGLGWTLIWMAALLGVMLVSRNYKGGVSKRSEPALSKQDRIRACNLGDPEQCVVLVETSTDPNEKRELARRACLAGDARSCVLGSEASHGEDKRRELLELGCMGRQPEACELLIDAARERVERHGDRDPLRHALVHACLLTPGSSCLEAAWYYHYGFVGRGRDEPATTADELLDRACNAEIEGACAFPRRRSLAAECVDEGDALACYAVGLADVTQGFASLERACELGLADGCYASGAAALHGRGTDEDLERAEQSFDRACSAGLARGCTATQFVARRRALPIDERPTLGADDPTLPLTWTPPVGMKAWGEP